MTSLPTHPQSNRKAEQVVKSTKELIKKAKKAGDNPYLALLAYHYNPTQGFSTRLAQCLTSWRSKALLPTSYKLLKPELAETAAQEISKNKIRQACYYNCGARDLEELQNGDTIQFVPPNQPNRKEMEKSQV